MQFHKHILENGLRLITVPMKDNPTVTVLVLVEAGSEYETKEINGLSHFLEHMCFKGTVKRPKALDISRELDGIGATYNAFTAQEYTGYYAKSDKRHFEKILDVVSDIYLNSVFESAEIEKEKGVIVEEINMYQDLPQKQVQENFQTLLYGDQSAGWPIAGTKEGVRSFNRDHFVAYKNKHYSASKTTVVVSGNIDEEIVSKRISEVFGSMNQSGSEGKEKTIDIQNAPVASIEYKKTDQTHMVLGVRTYPLIEREKNRVLSVLAALLGGGMSSRLFQKLREEMGATYYINAGNNAFSDHGFFDISAGVDVNRLPEVVSVLLGEMKRLKDAIVPNEELQRTKDYLTGQMYLGLEASDSIADYFGFQELFKREIVTPDEYAKEIQKVSGEAIQKMANDIFVTQHVNLAVIGNIDTAREKDMASLLVI
jgi:predicted Zn-dependent peptidase